MKRFLLALATVGLLGATNSWLDAPAIKNWNTAQSLPPVRAGAPDAQLAKGGRCANSMRPATSPEDALVVARGWSLIGPYQRYGPTVIVTAMSGADGMCRPEAYQSFVFVKGAFAGTLSPRLMNAREDASIAGLSVALYDANNFSVDYARYSPDDAMCCPHATTSVTFEIKTIAGRPRVFADSASTQKNQQ